MSTVQPSGTITNPAGTSIYGAAYGVEFTGSPASGPPRSAANKVKR